MMSGAFDDDVKQEDDGTWTVFVDYGNVKPIKGIPTRALAEHIAEQMWAMERAGADNALSD